MGSRVNAIEVEDGVTGYTEMVQWVLKNGKKTSPRGMNTVELEDAVVYINNVQNTLPLGTGRGAVAGIGAVEACQLLSGITHPALTVAVSPNFAQFLEPNNTFHGPYGVRTRGQYDHIIERLIADKDTRQAVVTLWNPNLDLLKGKKDYPCTVLHQFRIRDGKLNMSVYMRSNDAWLGAAYDWFQFTRVQIAIASVLDIEPGVYAHHVGSLHLYEQHFEKAEKLHAPEKQPEAIPAIKGRNWREVESSALLCLQAAINPSVLDRLAENEKWYADAMISAIEKNAKAVPAEPEVK
jgi:hypothetical protein